MVTGSRRVVRIGGSAVLGALSMLSAVACSGGDGRIVAVEAGAFGEIAHLDEGEPGPGPGDRYVFTGTGTDDDGNAVRDDWELLTISVEDGVEVRMSRGVFRFDDGSELVILGAAEYPVGGGTLAEDVVVERPVVGGSGRFAGATGTSITTHRTDGTWRWEFRLVDR